MLRYGLVMVVVWMFCGLSPAVAQDYPQEVREAFLEGCQESTSAAMCACSLKMLEARVPLSELVSGELADEVYAEIANSCEVATREEQGGCNVHGCWSSATGSCNVHGCTEWGECNVHGCPLAPGEPLSERPGCFVRPAGAPDSPEAGCNVHGCWGLGGGCNVQGCWATGGGCNVHGCWNAPKGSCNVHGCADGGACTMHGCPSGRVKTEVICP